MRTRGYSIIEVLLASVIMSILLIAAMNLMGQLSISRHAAVHEDAVERYFINTIQEIMLVNYHDPEILLWWGPESGESQRSDFDDIDDYYRWSGPVQDREGNPYPELSHLTAWFDVAMVSASDMETTVLLDEGFRRVELALLQDGQVVHSRRCVFANIDGT